MFYTVKNDSSDFFMRKKKPYKGVVADLSGETVDFSKAVTWPSECPKGSTYYLWTEDTVGSVGPASAHSPSHLSRRRSGTPGAV